MSKPFSDEIRVSKELLDELRLILREAAASWSGKDVLLLAQLAERASAVSFHIPSGPSKPKKGSRMYEHLLTNIELETIYEALDTAYNKHQAAINKQVRAGKPYDAPTRMRHTLKRDMYGGLLATFEDAIEDQADGCRVILRITRPIYD